MRVAQVSDHLGNTLQLAGLGRCPGDQTYPANPESCDPVVECSIISQQLNPKHIECHFAMMNITALFIFLKQCKIYNN